MLTHPPDAVPPGQPVADPPAAAVAIPATPSTRARSTPPCTSPPRTSPARTSPARTRKDRPPPDVIYLRGDRPAPPPTRLKVRHSTALRGMLFAAPLSLALWVLLFWLVGLLRK